MFKYENDYNIPSFTLDDYVYLDDSFCIHRFVKYRTYSEDDVIVNEYYDESGTGLKLKVKENTNPLIYDESGNMLIFNQTKGELISLISSTNESIKKNIQYDELDRVSSIYDIRNIYKKVVFKYNENNLLKTVYTPQSDTYYVFNYEGTKLLNITKVKGEIEKKIHEFIYDNNKITHIINSETLQAIALEYDNENRVTKVKEGSLKVEYQKAKLPTKLYCNDDIYVGENEYLSEQAYTLTTSSMLMKEEYLKEITIFKYFDSYTDIMTRKSITLRYYFDMEGTNISVLEKESGNKYFTITRPTGWEINCGGTTNFYINNKRVKQINKVDNKYTFPISIESLSNFLIMFIKDNDNFEYDETTNFTLSFWLKFNETNTSFLKASLKYKDKSNDTIEVRSVVLRKTLSNVWQQVTIPFILPYDQSNIDMVELLIEQSGAGDYQNSCIEISDMRINKGISNLISIMHPDNLGVGKELKLGDSLYYNDGEEKIVTLSESFYLTENDIISTYRSMYEETLKNKPQLQYDLYYCNKTKVKRVNEVRLLHEYISSFYFKFTFTSDGDDQDVLIPNYQFNSYNLIKKDTYNNKYLYKTITSKYINKGNNHYTLETINSIRTKKEYGDEKNEEDIDFYNITSVNENGTIDYEKYHNIKYDEYGTGYSSSTITAYTYDEYGNLLSVKKYSDEDESTESIITTYTYNSTFPIIREKVMRIESEGNIIEYTYNVNDSISTKIAKCSKSFIDGNINTVDEVVIQKCKYIYNELNELSMIEFYDKDDNLLHVNRISYGKEGNIDKVYDNSNCHGFSYSPLKDLVEIYNGSNITEKTTYEYSAYDDYIKQHLYYGNKSYEVTNKYDLYGKIVSIVEQDSTQEESQKEIKFEYHIPNSSYSKVHSVVKKITDGFSNKVYDYTFNDSPRYGITTSVEERNSYMVINRPNNEKAYGLSFINTFGNTLNFQVITNPLTNKLIKSIYYVDDNPNLRLGCFTNNYKYDNLDRLTRKYTDMFVGSNNILSVEQNTEYYESTNLPKKIKHSVCVSRLTPHTVTSEIEYEISYQNQNITKIKESGNRLKNTIDLELVNIQTMTKEYEYDNYNRLKKETASNGVELEYIYDDNTKMLKQVKKNNQVIKEYEYSSNKLTKYINNGNILNIKYDNYGNICKLGSTYITYNSRNDLEEYKTCNNGICSFVYNFQGNRIKKIKKNKYIVNYYYDGNNLIGELAIDEITGQSIRNFVYFYDSSGVCGIKSIVRKDNSSYSDYYYQFVKDPLGNITKIMKDGIIIGEYVYDAWGNHEINEISIENDSDRYVLYNNPFRYKGYYYDVETNLYYCNTRYFSPELCCWISPDSIEYLDPESINGLNLYCYANNNPIGIAYSSSISIGSTSIDGGMVSSIGNAFGSIGNSTSGSSSRNPLPAIPWLAENATTIYGSVSSLVTGIPIFSHYYKYASIINDEFKLYGISKWKTSLQLSNVSFKMGALDGALIGLNVLIDMYDSYQRGVSTVGILLGGALTAVSGVVMLFLNKGIMWATTTIGTAICPGIGTAIGFTVGLFGSILVDILLGGWIADWIDNNVK
ncbi:MAG: RHS repeat-associated core domain-containing protein [Bacilli bacterium]